DPREAHSSLLRGPPWPSYVLRVKKSGHATARTWPGASQPRSPPDDQTMRMTETFDHHIGQRRLRRRNGTSGTNPIRLRMHRRDRRLASLDRSRRVENQTAEADHAHVRRPEMFDRAIGDKTLAVLDRRVL